MRKTVILATLVAILLVSLTTGVFAQPLATVGERSNLGPDANWTPGVGPVEEPQQEAKEAPAQPEVQPQKPQMAPRVHVDPDDKYAELPNIKKATKIVLTGQHGKPDHDRRDGLNGRNGVDGKTIIREGHQGHQKPYQHIKSWNPASCSYVDAKIAAAGKTGSNHDWSWLWIPFWILFVLALIWLLANMLRNGWDWLICWLRSVLYPQPQVEKPDMTNSAGGNLFGIDQENADVPLKFAGLAVRIVKGILLGKPGDPWTWILPGQKVPPFNRSIGAKNRFCIAVENLDHFPMPTDQILIRDELVSAFPHVVEKASLWIGKQKLRDLTEDEKKELTSGKLFSLRKYIDCIPVGETVQFKYDVRVIGPTGHGRVESKTSGTDEDEAEETKPAVIESEFKLGEILAAREAKAKAEEAARRAAEAMEAAKKQADAAKVAEAKEAAAKKTTTEKEEKKPSADKTTAKPTAEKPAKKSAKKKHDEEL